MNSKELSTEDPISFSALVCNYDLYAIASALRGPDFNDKPGSGLLKAITTGVIRDLVRGESVGEYGLKICSPENARKGWYDADNEKRGYVRELWMDYEHFSNHVLGALWALRRYNVVGAAEYQAWLTGVMHGSEENK